MFAETKTIPFDLIPSKWKTMFERRMRNQIKRGDGFPINSDQYRAHAERCYLDDLGNGSAFDAILLRAHSISILEKRPFMDVLKELKYRSSEK